MGFLIRWILNFLITRALSFQILEIISNFSTNQTIKLLIFQIPAFFKRRPLNSRYLHLTLALSFSLYVSNRRPFEEKFFSFSYKGKRCFPGVALSISNSADVCRAILGPGIEAAK